MKSFRRMIFHHRIRLPISNRSRWALGVLGIAVLVIVYSCLSYRQHIRNPDDTTLPNLRQLVEGFRVVTTPETNELSIAFGMDAGGEKSFWDSWLPRDAWATFRRLCLGLLWGCSISVIVGTLMGSYEWLAAKLSPPLSFLAKVPGTAMLAVFFVLVGSGSEAMFISMIGFGVLPILTQSVYLSARDDLHDEEINKAYTLGASNVEVIWNVVFQKILPKVLDHIRLQIGPAMVFLIAAEMLVGEVGFGFRIRSQGRLQQMNVVYDYLLLLGISGLLMDRGMVSLRRWLCPWFNKG